MQRLFNARLSARASGRATEHDLVLEGGWRMYGSMQLMAARTRQRVTAAVWCAIALTFITTLMATVSVQYRSSNPQATEIPVLLTWSIGLAPILLAFVMNPLQLPLSPSSLLLRRSGDFLWRWLPRRRLLMVFFRTWHSGLGCAGTR